MYGKIIWANFKPFQNVNTPNVPEVCVFFGLSFTLMQYPMGQKLKKQKQYPTTLHQSSKWILTRSCIVYVLNVLLISSESCFDWYLFEKLNWTRYCAHHTVHIHRLQFTNWKANAKSISIYLHTKCNLCLFLYTHICDLRAAYKQHTKPSPTHTNARSHLSLRSVVAV